MKQVLFVALLALAVVPSSLFGQAQESFNLTPVLQSVSGLLPSILCSEKRVFGNGLGTLLDRTQGRSIGAVPRTIPLS